MKRNLKRTNGDSLLERVGGMWFGRNNKADINRNNGGNSSLTVFTDFSSLWFCYSNRGNHSNCGDSWWS